MVQSAARPRREIKPPEERRKDILDAALQLFVNRGFNETTVQDIATAAGMGTGTVYLYFPSKEHVLEGLHERFRTETERSIAAVAVEAIERAGRGEEVDYREVIDAILDAVANNFVENSDLVIVCTKYRPELMDDHHQQESGRAHHLSIVARALEEGVRMGLIHTSDPEMTAYLFDAALAYNLHMHITYGDPPDMFRVIAAAKEMFHKTLALPAETARKPAARRAPARRTRKP
ncbi:MAG: TetR/AcrR family transcriptional regulator [Actinomycetota bacterium]